MAEQASRQPRLADDKGTLERADKTTGYRTSQDALPHPAPSKETATTVAAAVAQEWGRFTAREGSQCQAARRGCRCVGEMQRLRIPIDGIDREAITVEHDVVPNAGWTTTIETDVKSD